MEPEAKVDIAADGASYSWEGQRIGEGSMTKTSEDSPHGMHCDLQFLKPWKSEAKASFRLDAQGESTRVSWSMKSTLPFFMFFMKKTMCAMIGMDYDRGLAMLKDHAETGAVPSQLEFTGPTVFEGTVYVGITKDCAISEVGPRMKADMQHLHQWTQDSAVSTQGYLFSIYHKWDMAKQQTQYTLGVPVAAAPQDLPEGFGSDEILRTEAYCLTHRGPYRHVGNAWSAGMNLARSKVFKQTKQVAPFEIYTNCPDKVDEKDVETKVYFPMVAG
jgi:predicted transcriptional regulator YdeE